MELRRLRYFCKACEVGSYTAAAEGLFVTEQTISAAIKRLEREPSCELLFRGKGDRVTTPMNLVLRRDRRPKSPARLLASWLLEVWGAGGKWEAGEILTRRGRAQRKIPSC